MATTISRYLKLKIDDNLSADAKSNLAKIDELGAIFRTNTEDNVDLSAKGNISLQPGDPAIGGTPNQSDLVIGQSSNRVQHLDVYADETRLRTLLRLKNGTVGLSDTFLNVVPAEENTNVTLNVSLADSLSTVASRSIIIGHSGRLVFENANQALTNKTIDGSLNTLSNISYSSLLLSGSIINSDISNGAAIATSKLSGPLTSVTGNGLGTLAGQNTASLTADVTGILPIANGGTGNDGSDRSTALINLLPVGVEERVLRYYNGQLEWYLASGTGTVQQVELSMPTEFTVSGSPITTLGTFTVTKVNQIANRVYAAPDGVIGQPVFRALVETDIPNLSQSKVTNLVSDLSGKEPTITGSGNASQFWNGNKTFTAVTKSDVGLGNVDNTSDVDKPISSAVSTALAGKYDASNPSAFVDASGAKGASVTSNINNVDQTLAPDCTAVKTYVAAAGGAMSFTWAAGTPASPISGIYYKTITHNLNSLYLTVTVLDNNEEVIWVDSIIPADVNSVVLGSSQQPPSDWAVIVRPAPAP